jgi:hypothetical protein
MSRGDHDGRGLISGQVLKNEAGRDVLRVLFLGKRPFFLAPYFKYRMKTLDMGLSQSPDPASRHLVAGTDLKSVPAPAILDQNAGTSGSSSFLSGFVSDKCVQSDIERRFRSLRSSPSTVHTSRLVLA